MIEILITFNVVMECFEVIKILNEIGGPVVSEICHLTVRLHI